MLADQTRARTAERRSEKQNIIPTAWAGNNQRNSGGEGTRRDKVQGRTAAKGHGEQAGPKTRHRGRGATGWLCREAGSRGEAEKGSSQWRVVANGQGMRGTAR